MFNKNKNQGFTLIELLLVIAIIGVLSGIVTIVVRDHIERARIARNQVFSHSIRMVIGDQMVGNWPLDSAAGIPPVTPDRSGWGNQGTLHNFPTPLPFEPGVVSNALRFDGVDDRVDVPDSASLNITDEVTIEAWVRPTLTDRIWTIVAKGNVWNLVSGYGLSLWNGNHRVVYGEQGALVTGSVVPLDTWTHLVAVRRGSEARVWIYINGVLDAGFPRTVTSNNLTNPSPLKIGTCVWNHHSFRGFIDEVRIYRAAMPTSYVQKQYVQGIKSLASNGGITQEEKQERIAVLRNSEQLAIDLDAALAGDIDFSQYDKYLAFQK